MIFVIILTFVYSISFYYNTSQFGVSEGCDWWNLITYSFIHTSIIHLIINSSLFLLYWNRIKNLNLYIVIPILIVTPIMSASLSLFQKPTVGASAIVMAMIGIITVGLPKRQILKIVVLIAFSFVTTALFASHINTLIHVYSFIFSSMVSLVLKRFIYDR